MTEKATKETVKEILKTVKELLTGTQYFLFKTTLERYEVQLNLMAKMKKSWEKDGLTVFKNYGGKPTQCTNPIIPDFNKTASAASTTVNALLKILDKAKIPDDKQTHITDLLDGLADE